MIARDRQVRERTAEWDDDVMGEKSYSKYEQSYATHSYALREKIFINYIL